MKKNNPEIETVKHSYDFMGIKTTKDSIKIFVPRMFRREEGRVNKDLLLFLKSISIAKKILEDNSKISQLENGEIWPIESYIWIIKDYIENGFYYNREKRYFHNQKGKINWKKTLNTPPIYSNGNIIYDHLITSQMTASNNIIAYIYKLCLKISLNRIGWAFCINTTIHIQLLKSIKEMTNMIKGELDSTYDDIKRMRFQHMLKILNELNDVNDVNKTEFNYGITNYYYVFEIMVDILLQGICEEEKKKYYPSGYWQLNDQDAVRSSNLRPDTIYKKENATYIIDAKMYQYGYTKRIEDLPMTSSMQKQITYGEFVKENIQKGGNIKNIFILPYNKELLCFKNDDSIDKYCDGNLAYIGRAFVDWKNDIDSILDKYIYTFLIDFNFLLRNYNRGDSQYIEQLCDSVK